MMKRNPSIQQELVEIGSFLAETEPVNVYRVPEGYFNTVVNDILQEINPKQPVISNDVPLGYFDQLADHILNRIKTEELEGDPMLLSGTDQLKQVNPYTVPAGYFSDLPIIIINRIKEEEGRPYLSQELLLAKSNNPYTVPEGYFNNLNPTAHLSDNKTQPKVVKMSTSRSIFKYAVAAMFTGLLGIGAFFYFHSSTIKTENSYASNERVMKDAQNIIRQNNFNQVLSNLSDQDIVNYLKSSGEDVNAALVASMTDEPGQLPNELDYLINDNTLNHLLNGIVNEHSTTN